MKDRTPTDFYIPSDDNIKVFARHWPPTTPAEKPLAVIHVVHGLAEHCLRYAPLANFLNSHNFAVVAHDHRGHGKTADSGSLGMFSHNRGWHKVLQDVDKVQQFIRQHYTDIPIIIFGHSMGSFITQAYISAYQPMLSACILSGSNFNNPLALRILRFIIRLECLRQGKSGRSKLIDWLSFGTFNTMFKPNRTAFDWLSKDPNEVDAYVNDPLCGQLSTNQLWMDFTYGLLEISQPGRLQQISKDLPMLVMGGELDPVSCSTKNSAKDKENTESKKAPASRLVQLSDTLRNAGIKKVDIKIYPHGRHEMLNEINRQEVFNDLLTWIREATPCTSSQFQ